MRREIIQSKTEPNKNNLWLSEEGLKKYGKNGWEPLGGGISTNTPIVDSISGDELVSINVNGENKAVSVEQIKNEVINNGVIELPSKYEFVDLGLPSGIKWATCNIGANSPEEAGLYFAWGETEGYTAEDVAAGKKTFIWDDYKFGTKNNLTKYNSTDGSTQLELIDDAAYQSDNSCRMPIKDECQELIDNTTSTWETLNGVYGRRFTSNINGNSIFVPAGGGISFGSVFNVGSNGFLRSSSLYEKDSNNSWYLGFGSSAGSMNNYYRYYGYPIRPIQPANTLTTINLKELQSTVDTLEIQAKDAKEVYQLDINNYSTPEDFNNLKEAIQNNNIIQLTSSYGHEIATIANYNEESDIIIINVCILVPAPPSYKDVGIQPFQYLLRPDGTKTILNQAVVTLETAGDGTKFLADDGSYKEVALPPYIWDGTTSETIFEELNEACVAKRRIILVNDDKYIVFSSFRKLVNNLILIGYPESFGITSTTVVEVATYKESDNSKQISSNKYNDISITSDTNITYNENVVPIQIPIFEGQLFFSDTVYNVTFPDDIVWSTDSVLEYKANHTYQFRIVNNLGVMKEFANA